MLTHLNANPTPPKRTVVLGAAGFVGGAVVRALTRCGAAVLALARDDLDLASATTGERLAGLLQPADALVIAAAKAPAKTDDDVIVNLQMMAAVTKALRRVTVGHVVYISSDAVYADSDAPLTERSCAQPASLHGVMHLAREVMLASAFAGPLAILRPTLIYGADDPHNGYGPNRFHRLATRGEDIVLFGEGEERRDHVLIDDVAEIATRVLFRRSAGILNIATGEVRSFRQIADMVAAQFQRRSAVCGSPRQGPMPHNGYRPFDISACRAAFPDFRYTLLKDGLRQSKNELLPS
jgi:nucleoside-diphosphate-sugar epimerase